MVSYWTLSESKSPQVSRTLLSILAVFTIALVWMVSTRPPTSKSSRPFNNSLVSVPKPAITISIIFTFIFLSLFNSLARSRYSSLFSHFFSVLFCGQPRQQIRQFCRFSFFFVDYYKVYYYYYYYYPSRVFHTIIKSLSFTGVWVTASFSKSPEFFSVFWPILIVLSFGCTSLVFLFPTLSVNLPILLSLYRAHQLQLVSTSISCSIVFSSSLSRSRYLSLFSPFFTFILWSATTAKSIIRQVLCFLLILTRSGCLAEIIIIIIVILIFEF